MRVRRNFERIYAAQEDPWGIGEADSERYDRYVEQILAGSRIRGRVLELGCGQGALLARLRDGFEELVGIELSHRAVARGRERFPFIEFLQGSLEDLPAALPQGGLFDTIVVSDVLYYLPERHRRAVVGWMSEHLAPGGLAFVAGWSPGGRYLTPHEVRNLIERDLAVESEQVLDSGHAMFSARRRRILVALTVDYETWQPQLEGRALDWETDALRPTARLMEVLQAAGAKMTIFAEMGEQLWLREHRPELAETIEEQWREALRQGHDVQLHLHPNWLPEMGPRELDGRWTWDMQRTRAADYPGELNQAIARCKTALETALRPAAPAYEVVAFRAGTYEAQPFDRLYEALRANGIWCDSSVLPGDRRPGRHYDYRHAYADHQPWFAARYDPQLKAPPAERAIVEVPVFAPRPGQRWTFDNEEGAHFAERLLQRIERERRRPSSEALRRRARLRALLGDVYVRLRRFRGVVNRVMPRPLARFMTSYERERLVADSYFVLLAHTKTELAFDAIAEGARRLAAHPEIELVSMSELARHARAELERGLSSSRAEEGARQVEREYAAQMSDERNLAQSDRLQALVPLDAARLLDAGCGRGVGTARLARSFPWMTIVGADMGRDFVERATAELAGDRLSFVVQDFAELSFPDGEFDCVHADNSLEHAFDVDLTLAEIHRTLRPGGCLVAALPPDGLEPGRTCDNHTWKTIPGDVRTRLLAAGFGEVELEVVDLFRELGMPPFPPSNDRMLCVRAWKQRSRGMERIRALTSWAYGRLDPERAQASEDPLEVLAGGQAWCWGYVLVLGEALRREGYETRWVTMIAEEHPRGRGPRRRETHEVLEVALPGGERVVCDPMVGIVFDGSLAELLRDPARADVPRPEDERYRRRSYALYSTGDWYRLVRRVALRGRPNARPRYLDAARVARRA